MRGDALRAAVSWSRFRAFLFAFSCWRARSDTHPHTRAHEHARQPPCGLIGRLIGRIDWPFFNGERSRCAAGLSFGPFLSVSNRRFPAGPGTGNAELIKLRAELRAAEQKEAEEQEAVRRVSAPYLPAPGAPRCRRHCLYTELARALPIFTLNPYTDGPLPVAP